LLLKNRQQANSQLKLNKKDKNKKEKKRRQRDNTEITSSPFKAAICTKGGRKIPGNQQINSRSINGVKGRLKAQEKAKSEAMLKTKFHE
jgi:hypothetical protein